jgi:mono/diheme cytochrome c family protein
MPGQGNDVTRMAGSTCLRGLSADDGGREIDRSRVVSSIAATVLAVLALSATAQGTPVRYMDLEPILASRCVMCHQGAGAPLGLRLDTLEGLLAGSSNGPVAKPGAPGDSELMRRLRGSSQPRMPMTGPPFLPEEEIALFERWIAQGMPHDGSGAPSTAPMAPARPQPGEMVTYAHVAPIFATRCAKCHTERGLMGPAPEGYRLTSYAATLSAADRARVVPGQPEASELLRRLRGQALPRMPYDGPPYLESSDIELIEEWIRQGARDAAGVPAAVPAGAKVRLHGTLASGWMLDGLVLSVGSDTRRDKSPSPGSYVEVRGRLDPDGRVIAERIRSR